MSEGQFFLLHMGVSLRPREAQSVGEGHGAGGKKHVDDTDQLELTPSSATCHLVTLAEGLNTAEPQFAHLSNGYKNGLSLM